MGDLAPFQVQGSHKRPRTRTFSDGAVCGPRPIEESSLFRSMEDLHLQLKERDRRLRPPPCLAAAGSAAMCSVRVAGETAKRTGAATFNFATGRETPEVLGGCGPADPSIANVAGRNLVDGDSASDFQLTDGNAYSPGMIIRCL